MLINQTQIILPQSYHLFIINITYLILKIFLKRQVIIKSKQYQQGMQEINDYQQLKHLGKMIKKLNKSNQALLLQFLDQETIEIMFNINEKRSPKDFIFRLAAILYLMKKYINRVDRSYYFLFYEENQFTKIEKQHFQKLALANIQCFSLFPYIFKRLMTALSHQLSACSQNYTIIQNIQNLIFQSDIPMPKIKKQTVAMYCESAFQLFLAEMKFPSMGEGEQDWQLDLKKYLQSHYLQYLQLFLTLKLPLEIHQHTRNKILTVRYNAKIITSNNYDSYLIQNCQLHNFIVIIIAIIDNIIQTYHQIIANHQDPFMKFIQFNLRYSIFRNMIISIQQRLQFVLAMYHALFKTAFIQYQIQPKYSFWLSAMSKWTQKMEDFDQDLYKVYLYIVTNQRDINLLNFLEKQSEQLPSVFNPIRNAVNQRDFTIKVKEQLYKNGSASIQSFFQQFPQNYQILAKDFVQYLVDTSINEYSVHWCGFSAQYFPINSPYYKFNKVFLSFNNKYLKNLTEIVLIKSPQGLNFTILKEILQSDLSFIDSQFMKPFTSKNVLETTIQHLKQLLNQEQLGIFEVDEEAKPKLDFTYKDNLLKYFNQKAEIPYSCQEIQQPFYDCSQKIDFESPIQTQKNNQKPEFKTSESELLKQI